MDSSYLLLSRYLLSTSGRQPLTRHPEALLNVQDSLGHLGFLPHGDSDSLSRDQRSVACDWMF